MVETFGTCTDRFAPVRAALAASLDDRDVGASVAVFLDGEPVVDLWGGHVDEARTTLWERDTITNTWSTTKTMTALSALVLADRGELDLDSPVARYWPEFAANGKEDVLVRQLLGHTAGLPVWDAPMTVEDLYDWPLATARLAAQAPAWKPGAEGGYHAVTFGHLVGEVVRRVTGRTLGAFFAEEIAGPLGADFHIGLPREHDHRVSPVIPPAERPLDPDAAPGNPPILAATAHTEAWRRAEVPAGNGHGNARSVAAVQSVLSCGGTARGVRLLSEAGCARALEEQFTGTDAVLGMPMRWGMGYALSGDQLPNPRTCSWGGWGGSMVLVDMDARLTVAYVMNRMLDADGLGDDRAFLMMAAAYEGLSG
ncbi:serine hydrolase domain-containing protein [Streptomyces sp. AK08-02]|uniref:serine hydrolase domain-containing protein n=1 Tax=Streptomyces sp. AK08-02 TaxID=3028654 RepID=UPI0029A884F5|nr:serine hydrolase domain-containing protein [Streptomyces sp. AK08-02]MDX3747053.1 serine hydrolase [Streptomyces sp. AK08-02]